MVKSCKIYVINSGMVYISAICNQPSRLVSEKNDFAVVALTSPKNLYNTLMCYMNANRKGWELLTFRPVDKYRQMLSNMLFLKCGACQHDQDPKRMVLYFILTYLNICNLNFTNSWFHTGLSTVLFQHTLWYCNLI